jgi:hypothetical protein
MVNNEALLRTAVIGIADACVQDADERLATLLAQAIDECSVILDGARSDLDEHTAASTRHLALA